MTADVVDALSDEHREAVRAALDAAFGSSRVDSIAFIDGGASGAFLFRVDVGRQRYVVRLEGRASPLRNPHQYESMRIASAVGIAPKLYHVDDVNRVAVMDFVDERPLSTFPGGPPALSSAVGAILGRVQGTPAFPAFIDYPEIVGRLWRWVCQQASFRLVCLLHVRSTWRVSVRPMCGTRRRLCRATTIPYHGTSCLTDSACG